LSKRIVVEGGAMAHSMESLLAFLDAAVKSNRYEELRSAILDHPVVGSEIWGITLLDHQQQMIDIAGRNVSDTFLSTYEQQIRPVDPVLKAVVERHTPIHDLQLGPPESWHRETMYRDFMSPYGLDHVMFAPVVGEGRIAATLHFVRRKHSSPYSDDDWALASSMANHVSALLARFAAAADELPPLTARELEVARLVALGLNNLEIGRHLSISRNTVKEVLKRVFRKLHVDARAEMAARLSAARVL
jgi:DNA-binding CsgD family transcriptional regulator